MIQKKKTAQHCLLFAVKKKKKDVHVVGLFPARLEREELHLEQQRGASGDLRRGAAFAVGIVGLTGEHAFLAHLRYGDTVLVQCPISCQYRKTDRKDRLIW